MTRTHEETLVTHRRTIDFRPMQNKLRDGCAQAAFMTGLSAACAFTLALLTSKGAPDVAYGALIGLWLLVLLISIVVSALATVRQVVARADALEVDGVPVAWRHTSAPKLGFFCTLAGVSRPAWAWISIEGRQGPRDLLIVAHPEDIAAAARLREVDLAGASEVSSTVPCKFIPRPSSTQALKSARAPKSGISPM